MARPKTQYVCVNCGAVWPRWQGRCDACGEWNTLQEEGPAAPASTAAGRGNVVMLRPLSGKTESPPRLTSGIAELDRVTGGGFVPASALLVGGDPGIGKSTLLLQAAASLARDGRHVIYVSGEEAIDQVRLRAERLGVVDAPVQLAAETHIEDILATLKTGPKVDVVIVDSIQTMWTDLAESAPGTVTQVRLASQNLIRLAKSTGAVVILVGHVTKDGQIAGPRVVEHMVDAVLYFEGDAGHRFRLLRAVKNRFGPASEIGVFEMAGDGLREVANPSDLFIGERDAISPGTAIFAGMEGTRPLLVEVQALVSQSSLATPRRAVVGWDPNRLAMLLAVLEARCGLRFGQFDVYLNVAGGLRIAEPAADLAIAAALISSRTGVATPPDSIYFGEVSLSGTIRAVAQSQQRLKEAEKLGFRKAFLPEAGSEDTVTGLALDKIATLADMVAAFAARAQEQSGRDRNHQ
ncbi:DNA repair protein RadA [Afifella marina]|uniref:DNA repair protein RadA n=1 Tax=Afifella marina DSM 2698 TaxID=1120955 RepID=A0A1G5N1U0_AFIMA|nr:DNA repair protein RadA [Afifella marina]MBK1622324.1 DNA repair protein RadA [Afifella marina DSM 2698]MBK1626962.1 DNA repair protein RadA [Afifella marina]MBK5919108.1 DNA repair protein RadA [Afifella marina]RAI20161.1 DNA repair protein RadA [Afifella marina DSM 2698]SCZ31366.1 DNA repair protein RadA/Sms [Afifella marina DSM 2698]